MTWSNITLMDCDSGLSPKLKDEHAKLWKRMEGLKRSRGELDERSHQLASGEMTADVIQKLNDVRNEKLVLWQAEIKLRDDYSEWLKASAEAFVGLRRKVEKDQAKAEKTVRQKLVDVGYVDGPEFELDPSRVVPSMWLAHPSVRKLAAREVELGVLQESVAFAVESNGRGRESTCKEMDAYRAKVLAAMA